MNKLIVSIVCALDKNRGIGKDNKLMWHIPHDLKRFKQITSGHPIIMGRKTFESIGRLLPNRTNIIITRDQSYKIEGAIVVHSLSEAIKKARNVILSETKELDSLTASQNDKEKEVFIIGGGQIFEQALPIADKLYLTIVTRLPSPGGKATGGQDGQFNADTFFPDYSEFKTIVSEQKENEGEYSYTFIDLIR